MQSLAVFCVSAICGGMYGLTGCLEAFVGHPLGEVYGGPHIEVVGYFLAVLSGGFLSTIHGGAGGRLRPTHSGLVLQL